MVNSFLRRKPIWPNGKVTRGWVRSTIQQLMSWQPLAPLAFIFKMAIMMAQLSGRRVSQENEGETLIVVFVAGWISVTVSVMNLIVHWTLFLYIGPNL